MREECMPNRQSTAQSTQTARSAPTRAPKGLVGGEARLDRNPLAPDNDHPNEPRQSDARTPQTPSWSVCCPAPWGQELVPGPRGPETPPGAEAWLAVVHLARPDVQGVAHHHTRSVLLFTVTDIPLKPLFPHGDFQWGTTCRSGTAVANSAIPTCWSTICLRPIC